MHFLVTEGEALGRPGYPVKSPLAPFLSREGRISPSELDSKRGKFARSLTYEKVHQSSYGFDRFPFPLAKIGGCLRP